jgi:hypothetical protein
MQAAVIYLLSVGRMMQSMKHHQPTWESHPGKRHPAEPILDETTVRPYGASGVGILTAHPVGLVLSVGIILMVLISVPESRWFFAGSVALGAAFGFVLWLRHR